MSEFLPNPPPRARRRRLRIFLGVVMIAMVVVVAGLFFARRQIGDRLMRSLGEQLAATGVFITCQSADWVPGPGIRLRGLALYRDAAKHDRLALFDLVTAIKGDPAWNRWDKVNFKTADTQLVIGSGADEAHLEHMGMLLLLQPGRTELRDCHASLQGLRIEAKGVFAHAAPAGEAREDAASKQPLPSKSVFRDVNLDWLKPVKEWMKFQPVKDEPVLSVELHSLRDERGLELAMTFDGTRFQWRGQKWDFVQAAAKSSIGGKKSPIEFDHLHVGHAGRKAEIVGAFDPTRGVVRFSKLESGIDLLALARVLVPDAVGSLSAVRTMGAWRISGAGEIPVDHPENCRWQGDMALDGDLVYASGETNVVLQKPAFTLLVDEQVVSISDFKAGLWEGSLNAPKTQVRLPSKEKSLRIETQLTLNGARSQSVRKSFTKGRKQPDVVPIDWKGVWRISVAGEIPMDQPENFCWNADMALGDDLVYASGETKVALQKPVFAVRLETQVLSISDFKAGLWEGSLNAPRTVIYLPSAKQKMRFETQVGLNGARLQAIIGSFGDTQQQPGVVQCDWKGGGEFELASLVGSGALSIGEAEFCRMPILGPLHLVFEQLTPQFQRDMPSTMAVNHRFADGTLYLEDLKLVSKQFRIEASGNIDLAREYAQVTAKGRLQNIQGLATVLLTSLLEFKGEGPVDDVQWALKSIPGVHVIGKAVKKTTKTATEAMKGTGRALKGLIELPGKLLPDK